uniref:NAD(P)-binding domain-containing protein n=1 Tax=Globisporangium ultimum (strain ATCC 200006 / CBS 805.95 / DAOM BR144) TaxID=431595 RepID=K3W6B1_GLOUD
MAQQHKVIVTGASGSVGRRVVHFALKHKSVESVTALLRSGPEKNAAFFGLDPKNPSDKEVFDNKLKQKIVDYNAPEDVVEATKGHTAGISCLGVYTADVKNVDDFMDQEYKPNLAVARAAAATGTKRWGYLSGNGVKQPERSQTKPGFFEPIFAFTKGSIERDLSAVEGFEATTSARPAMILHRENHYPGTMKYVEDWFNNWKWFSTTRFAVETDDIAKALVHSIVKEQDLKLNEILENEDIKRVAREFDTADAK